MGNPLVRTPNQKRVAETPECLRHPYLILSTDLSWKLMENYAGVYIFLYKGRCSRVGKARCLGSRIEDYYNETSIMHTDVPVDEIFVIPWLRDDKPNGYEVLEQQLILMLSPTHNVRGVSADFDENSIFAKAVFPAKFYRLPNVKVRHSDGQSKFEMSHALSGQSGQRLVDAWRQRRSKKTLEAYDFDLKQFAVFTEDTTPVAAAARLIEHGHGPANELAARFKYDMLKKNLSSATINRRLSALRSIIAVAQRIGLISWSLSVDGERAEPRRETKGPKKDAIEKMIRVADENKSRGMAARDIAMIRLMFNRGLRRDTVASLELSDIDCEKLTLRVTLKGYREKKNWSMPPSCGLALKRWIDIRGTTPGRVFDLAGGSIWRIIKRIGAKAGFRCWPHALRHSGATEGYEKTKDLSRVQKFLGHSSPTTTARYIDDRGDPAGDVARAIEGD